MARYNLAQTPLLIATIVYVGIILIALIIILSIRTNNRIENLISDNTKKVKVISQQNVAPATKKVNKRPVRQARPVTAYSSTTAVTRS